jgi:hypothetical protein
MSISYDVRFEISNRIFLKSIDDPFEIREGLREDSLEKKIIMKGFRLRLVHYLIDNEK